MLAERAITLTFGSLRSCHFRWFLALLSCRSARLLMLSSRGKCRFDQHFCEFHLFPVCFSLHDFFFLRSSRQVWWWRRGAEWQVFFSVFCFKILLEIFFFRVNNVFKKMKSCCKIKLVAKPGDKIWPAPLKITVEVKFEFHCFFVQIYQFLAE